MTRLLVLVLLAALQGCDAARCRVVDRVVLEDGSAMTMRQGHTLLMCDDGVRLWFEAK